MSQRPLLSQEIDCSCGTQPQRPAGVRVCARGVGGAVGPRCVQPVLELAPVLALLRQPGVWSDTVADGGASVDDIDWAAHWPGVVWLGVWEECGALLGVFLCAPQGYGVCEVHTYFSQELRGREAVAAGKAAVRYVWDYFSNISVLTTRVPTFNRHAVYFAAAVGFYYSATLPEVGRKSGRPYDVICMQLSRGQWAKQSESE